MCVTLEGLWIISDRIVDFRFFVKFHKYGLAIFFSSWAITDHVLYASIKILIKEKTRSTWWVFLWKYYGWFLLELSIFDFSSNFTGPKCNILQFLNNHRVCSLCIKKAPNQGKNLINMVSVTLEVLWMISDRIVDFRFFVKFHRSWPAKIFKFWTTMVHVSYASKKLLIKQKSSSTLCVLLWKDYWWFLIEL